MSERVAACYDPASHMTRFTLILPAAGNSSRFGSNKLLASLGGETVFARTLAAFADHPALAGVIVASQHPNVLQQAAVKVVARIEARGVPVLFVPGGDSRAQSVANAANAANPDVEFLAFVGYWFTSTPPPPYPHPPPPPPRQCH
jgi:2-C-methyl-D-erythritol 4-phosphate cytidylyltransferase